MRNKQKESIEMAWSWNICSICKNGMKKMRGFTTRVPGSAFFVTTLLVICILVPNSRMPTYNHHGFGGLSKSDMNSSASITDAYRSLNNTESNVHALKFNHDLTKRGKRKFSLVGRADMFEANRNCSQKLPDAIIIGVMKAGTEAFSTFLAINPQVAMSFSARSTLFFTSRYSKGLQWYKQQMTCTTSNQTTIEKAPQYFPNPLAPKRIHKMNKNIKLILLVRNPIDRTVSHFLQMKNSHPERLRGKTFEDVVFTLTGAVNPASVFIRFSKYSIILKNWLRYFKLSQILILDSDEFVENEIQVLAKAESFLGIKHYISQNNFVFDNQKGFPCLNVNGSPKCLGSGKGREHPKLQDRDIDKLKDHFRRYNEEFFQMTRQRYTW